MKSSAFKIHLSKKYNSQRLLVTTVISALFIIVAVVLFGRSVITADYITHTSGKNILSSGISFGLRPVTVTGGPTWPNSAASFQPTNTLDNNPNTYWAGDPSQNDWALVYDFGAVTYLENLTIHFFSRQIKGAVFVPQRTTILASTNGVDYTTVVEWVEKNNDEPRLTIGQRARYIKIMMSGKSDAPNYRQAAIQDVTFTGNNALVPAGVTGGTSWPWTNAYLPDKTIDNTTTTYWAGDPRQNSWSLVYDFGGIKYVNDLSVQYFPREKRNIIFVPQNLNVFSSDDGITYVLVKKTGDKVNDLQRLDLGVNARYIKLTMTGRSDSPSNRQPQIEEVVFTGSDRLASEHNDVVSYSSAFDNTRLVARTTFIEDGRLKPLVIIMHGWGGSIDDMQEAADWGRDHGVFAVSVAMRGRDGSQGVPDAGRVEIHDIYDAVQYALRQYPGEIDRNRVAIWGFSGGGGNAFSAATKLPDTFNQVGIFFGMNDYAAWRTNGAGDRIASIDAMYGGNPDQVPVRYLASRSLDGVGNNPWSDIQLFWDEQENICPPYFDENWLSQSSRLRLRNSTGHKSLVTDIQRWLHAYPAANDSLEWAMGNVLLPRLLSSDVSSVMTIPDQGAPQFHILGWMATKKFAVYLGTSDRAVADMTYNYVDKTMSFTFSNATTEIANAKAKVTIPLNSRTLVSVDGGQAQIIGNNIVVSNVQLTGTVTVRFK